MVQTPNHFKQDVRSGRRRMVSARTNVLANSYDPTSDATRPVLSFPCKDIISINDVTVWCTGGYYGVASAKQRNSTTMSLEIVVRVYNPTNVANLADHAAHTHTITTAAASGGGVALTISGGALNTAGGAMSPVTGIQNAAAMAHAATATANGGVELDSNNSAFTIYGTAIAYV